MKTRKEIEEQIRFYEDQEKQIRRHTVPDSRVLKAIENRIVSLRWVLTKKGKS